MGLSKVIVFKKFLVIIVMIVAMISFSGCENSNSLGEGHVEFNGKTYPLNECEIVVTSDKEHYEVLFRGANSLTDVRINGSFESEFAVGVYDHQIALGGFIRDIDDNTSESFPLDNVRMEVTKSDNNYDIEYTGTTVCANDDTEYDFKLTYKGKIKVEVRK